MADEYSTNDEKHNKPRRRTPRKSLKVMTSYNNHQDCMEEEELIKSRKKSTIPSFEIIPSPELIEITGVLSKTNEVCIYTKIKGELSLFREKYGDAHLLDYVQKRSDLIHAGARFDDDAVMTLIQGCYATMALTRDKKASLRKCKEICTKVENKQYQIQEMHTVISTLYYHMFLYYMALDKVGKAFSAMQLAIYCIQHHLPNMWTALVYHSQGMINDRLAQIKLKNRKLHQQLAEKGFLYAREHYLRQSFEKDNIYSYYPILYTLYLVSIKLDMPINQTVKSYENKSRVVYNRLEEFTITGSDIEETEKMLEEVETRSKVDLAPWCHMTCTEIILLLKVYLNIRKTQLALSKVSSKPFDTHHYEALQYCATGLELHDTWKEDYADEDSFYSRQPCLPTDTRDILEKLHGLILIKIDAKCLYEKTDSSTTPQSQ